MSIMLHPCIFCVALSMDLFVLCVCELFGETIRNMLWCVVILLLNFMDVLIDRVWSSKECVCCACDPSVHLDVPSIGFVYVCMSEVISSLRSFRAGSQEFALPMLFLCVIVHTM